MAPVSYNLQRACGCQKRFFNEQYKYILLGGSFGDHGAKGLLEERTYIDHPYVTDEMRYDHLKIPSCTKRIDAEDKLEAFLHDYFHVGVDCDPGPTRVRYTRHTWREIYNDAYKEVCHFIICLFWDNLQHSIANDWVSKWLRIVCFATFVERDVLNTNDRLELVLVGGTMYLVAYVTN